MAKENQTATFSTNLAGNVEANAGAQANALEALRARVLASQGAVKELTSTLSRLKGKSAEVVAITEELKAKRDSERAAISSATLALAKAGTTTEKLAAASKKAGDDARKLAEEQKRLKDATDESKQNAMKHALEGAHGPIVAIRDKLEGLSGMMRGGSAAASVLTLAAVGLAAAIAAVASAAIAGGIALSKWIIESANAARTSNLVREAVTGTAENAKNLGDQISLLSSKLSTPKEKLQELSLALAKTRLSGQAQVDTFNAVGQAADAMGDEVGNKLKDIATRGQLFGRIQINPFELIGTGINLEDVAGNLAKQLGTTTAKARQALAEGRVKIDAGVKAIRTTVEKRFAEVNARKALDFGVQLEKMHDRLVALTRDVNLDPFLKGVAEIGKDFDESTVTGKALKDTVTKIGDELSKTFGSGAPIVHKAIQGMVIGALSAGIAFLELRNSFRTAFGDDTLGRINLMGLALSSAAAPGKVLAEILQQIEGLVRHIGDGIAKIKAITGGDATKAGKEIITGLATGMNDTAPVDKATKGIVDRIKNALIGTHGFDIHSPSKWAERKGAEIPAGAAKGIAGGAPAAAGAAGAMVPAGIAGSSGSASAGVAGSSARLEVHFHVHAAAGASPETVKAIESPDLLAALTKAIDDVLAQSGGGAGVIA